MLDTAFILGAPRSGTTLLRVMLAGHPRLFSPPEMVLAPFDTMAERQAHMTTAFWEEGGLLRALIDLEDGDAERAGAAFADLSGRTIPAVYAELRRRIAPRILVDKCTHLTLAPGRAATVASWFPEARYIWIVRHPGSVIRSIETNPAAVRLLQRFPGGAEEVWALANETTRAFLETLPPERWTMVRYEDLVADPRPVLERICALLGIEFHETMLDPYHGDRMREERGGAVPVGDPNMAAHGRIRPELATEWLRGFDARRLHESTRRLAAGFGYVLGDAGGSDVLAVRDAMDRLWETVRGCHDFSLVPDELDVVEGERFLLRLLAASIDRFVEHGDPERPELHFCTGPQRKMFADSPDLDIRRAAVRPVPGRSYHIRGRVVGPYTYFGFETIREDGSVAAVLHDHQLDVAGDGRFELVLATSDRAPGIPRMQAWGNETALLVTQYYTDRAREAPIELEIECTGGAAPQPLDAASFAARVGRAAAMVQSVVAGTVESGRSMPMLARHRFIDVPSLALRPRGDYRFKMLWFRLAAGQCLLVRGRRFAARYFGFALHNSWLESLDAARHRIALNHAGIHYGAGGSFELCVARENPGHPNWLDTAGHASGFLTVRALLPEDELPPFEVELVEQRRAHEHIRRP